MESETDIRGQRDHAAIRLQQQTTPAQLFARLIIFFTILIGAVATLALTAPDALRWLPLAGTDALEAARLDVADDVQDLLPATGTARAQPTASVTPRQAGLLLLFLANSLVFAMLVMLPITWTYKATQQQAGYRKTFVRALIVLPVCATTIVLLIQDSLALAFGLAALVAAVRFRVALKDPLDGIYIFAAICVGLAAGIGFIGIATVMAIIFCFANTWLWHIDYGQNPLDDARSERDRARIDRP